MSDVVQWMDAETLLLLFSMMILVAILTETGIFDFIAVYAFQVVRFALEAFVRGELSCFFVPQITNGRIWSLIFSLCFISALVSAFLDNVTTILLMTPITIKLCECLELNPVPVLMALIVNVNVGATATPLGHVPNLMITTNQHIVKHGITFLTYTLHMIVGVILLMIQTCGHLRLYYNDIHKLRLKEPKEIKELRRQIGIWERTARSLSSYTKDADLVRETLWKKVKILKAKLKKKETEGVVSSETYKATLDELKQSVSDFVETKPIRPDIQFRFCIRHPISVSNQE